MGPNARSRLLRIRGGHPFTATRVLYHMDSAPHSRRSPGLLYEHEASCVVYSAPAEVTRRK
ncbi:hypothetical protein [Streptomyces sp. NBC_00038]|uniref:hypothetical protein n=1 Tax=Streptomyces sp. NBC_00038 TaxID=2903615 RepID=UPI002253BD96|nr:hypothetical protein [Streptomyces sp. NBC_00038]MCX5555292.1 hypothetical protein [Streptomyces sp. NBC_00038]